MPADAQDAQLLSLCAECLSNGLMRQAHHAQHGMHESVNIVRSGPSLPWGPTLQALQIRAEWKSLRQTRHCLLCSATILPAMDQPVAAHRGKVPFGNRLLCRPSIKRRAVIAIYLSVQETPFIPGCVFLLSSQSLRAALNTVLYTLSGRLYRLHAFELRIERG